MGLFRRKKEKKVEVTPVVMEKEEIREKSVVKEIKEEKPLDERNTLEEKALLVMTLEEIDYFVRNLNPTQETTMTRRDGILMPHTFVALDTLFGALYSKGFVYKLIIRLSEELYAKNHERHVNSYKSDYPSGDDFYGFIIDSSFDSKELKELLKSSYEYVSSKYLNDEKYLITAKSQLYNSTKEFIERKEFVDEAYEKAILVYKPTVEEIKAMSNEDLKMSISVGIKASLKLGEETKEQVVKKEPEVESIVKEEPVKKAPVPVQEDDDDDDDDDDEATDKVVVKATFANKLAFADDKLKEYYSALRNHFESYKKCKERMSNSCDSYRIGRNLVAKMKIAGKTLKLYLALNPNDFEERIYHQKDVSEKKSFVLVPLMLKIKSNLALKKAMELIDVYMTNNEIPKNKTIEVIDYASMFMADPDSILAKGGFALRSSVNVSEAHEAMSDDVALENVVEEEKERPAIKVNLKNRVKGVVNIDTLSQVFKANDVITLESLLEKKLVAKNCNTVKVLARGVIDKPLVVKLDDFSLDAIKMILITGGKVVRKKVL